MNYQNQGYAEEGFLYEIDGWPQSFGLHIIRTSKNYTLAPRQKCLNLQNRILCKHYKLLSSSSLLRYN